MKMKALFMLVFVVAFGFLAPSDGFAAIYQYSDKGGIICFADDLQSIPEQYRAMAKIVSGEVEAERKPAKQNQAQSEAKPGVAASSLAREKGTTNGGKKSSFSNRLLISLIVVVSALFSFIILGIVDADHKKAVKISRVVIVWGVSVYLIFAHGGDVVRLFSSAGNKIESVQRESEEKGKKAAKAMKELNALMQRVDKAAAPHSEGTGQDKKE